MSFSAFRLSAFVASCASLWQVAPVSAQDDPAVRAQGVAYVAKALRSAILPLSKVGIELKVAEDCGNVPAVAALGAGEIDIALLGRSLTAEERATYPERQFHEFQLGFQAIVIMVSRSVWESGVRALTKEQITDLYEGRITSWKALGGEDRPAKFFEPAHGHGTWEIFANWLYGDVRKAPAVPWEEVPGGAEAQTAVQFQAGSASVAPIRWADRREVFPLSLIDESGAVLDPTPENIASGKYPLARPAYMVTGDRPVTHRRKVIAFMETKAGQEIVAQNDLLPIQSPKAP